MMEQGHAIVLDSELIKDIHWFLDSFFSIF
jgi:hypothetical protein